MSEQNADSGHPDSPDDDGLGPLPPNWEKALTDKGEPYFIDHNTGKDKFCSKVPNSVLCVVRIWNIVMDPDPYFSLKNW